jgi:hypothetical protein
LQPPRTQPQDSTLDRASHEADRLLDSSSLKHYNEDSRMLTLFLGLTIGYCLRKFTVLEMLDEGGTASAEIDFGQLIKDFIWLFEMLGTAAVWVVNAGRSTRNYFDAALTPWLKSFGISIKLPTIQLPVMPSTAQLN